MQRCFFGGALRGTLTIANSEGSITLSLVGYGDGLGPKGFPQAATFEYTITDGTGVAAGLSGKGTATLMEATLSSGFGSRKKPPPTRTAIRASR